MENRVKKLYREGKPSFGAYIHFPTAASVEVAAIAGLDFVRLDPYHINYSPENLENMVRTAYAHGITPWARTRNDRWVIMSLLDMGIQAITIPNCPNAEAARAAVNAVYYPPKGDREMSRPLRFRATSADDYLEWAFTQLIVSCQIEGTDGLENYKEIIAVEGVDCIQTGRGDLALALGVPGDQFHPKVLEAEKRIVSHALAAGKQVSLVHPVTEDGVERMQRWIEQGVRIITFEPEYPVLMREYGGAVKALRSTERVPA